jgi:serine/threonine-protein kinase/endoribonuclease IRE1
VGLWKAFLILKKEGRTPVNNFVGSSSSSDTKNDELKTVNASASRDTLRMITVSEEILGFGSHGTVVYKGGFEGRPVAVKRLLLDFYDVAETEVNLLRDSDPHPNVCRQFI